MAPKQSVELLPARSTDRLVREAWQRLVRSDLPSLGRHRGPSNRPHLTLVTRTAPLTDEEEERVADAVTGRLPITSPWGEVTTFGHGPYTVVRLVRLTPALTALQAALADVVSVAPDDLTAPPRWTPHVSFAGRVPAEQLGAVVDALRVVDLGPRVTWISARRWNPLTRVARVVVEPEREPGMGGVHR